MGGMADSAGGFLGLSDGPQAPKGNFNNQGLDQMNRQNAFYSGNGANYLRDVASGKLSEGDYLNMDYGSGEANQEAQNALATNALTGSKYATEQVQNNGILGGLYGQGGQLNQAEDQLSGLYKQGFDLKPEDQTAYGQQAGNISRMFGQQGNQTANDLASRGLSSSGAAGAAFSGLAGNQNEQLSRAQQQIAQQRFQNTQQQIGQYQNFVNNMGGNASNAINSQFNRQVTGAQNQRGMFGQAASDQMSQNNASNQYNMQAAEFAQKYKPENFMDQSINNSDTASSAFAQSLGSAGGSMAGGGMSGGGGGGGSTPKASGSRTSGASSSGMER